MNYQSVGPDERLAQNTSHLMEHSKPSANTDNNNIIPTATTSATTKHNNTKINNNSGDCESRTTSRKQQERDLVECTSNESNAALDKETSDARLTNSTAKVNSNLTTSQLTETTDSDQQEVQQHAEERQLQQQEVQSWPPPPANNRSILILREIDPNVPESSVKEIFDSENCPTRPVHCEHALQNSWYVTFKNDEDARLALAYIRRHVVTWNGHPIMARYKPKPAVPSAVNQPPPHHHQHFVPTMVIQHITGGVVPQILATNTLSSTTAPAAAIVTTQRTNINGVGDVADAPLQTLAGHGGSDSMIAMHMAPESMVGSHHHNSSLTSIDQQPTAPLIGGHHHHHQPSSTYCIPQSSSPMMHLGGTNHLHHHQIPGAPQHYGYSAVAYYSQHGPVMAPWHYTNGPQYDLSEVFIYNGLAPYPSSNNKPSNSKVNLATLGPTTVSSAALLGVPVSRNAGVPSLSTSSETILSYQNQPHQPQHHQQHYHNHRNNNTQHQPRHYPPRDSGSVAKQSQSTRR